MSTVFPLSNLPYDCLFQPALLDPRFLPDNGIKYKEYAWAVERCAQALRTSFELHDRIVPLAAAPTIESLITFWGILRAGSTALLLNPKLPNAAIDRALKWVRANRLLGSEHCEHSAAVPLVGLGDALHSLAEALEAHPYDWNRPATVLLTSGSTADPKFVVHSLANHIASAEAANANIRLVPGDRWLLSLPLYHVAGIGVVMRCLAAGATVVFPEPDADLATTLDRYGITHVSLVATQLYRLLRDAKGRRALRSLKAVLLGGSAISEALIREAYEAGVPIHTSYGMTETASQIACTPPGASLDDLLSSGHPLRRDALRIADDGEILAGGESLFLGYLAEDATIARPGDGAWFHTGDLGQIDAAGRLCVTGRKDNQFISGGENIQPEEIERALLQVDGVAEATVVPVEDREWGHRPVAFVRTDSGAPPDALCLAAALSKALPRYKLPIAYYPWPEAGAPGIKVSRAQLVTRARALRHGEPPTQGAQ